MKPINLKTTRARRTHHLLEVRDRLEVNPKIALGKPVFRGTRITVNFVLKLLGQGMDPATVLREYPQLERADIDAALQYANRVVEQERIYPLADMRVAV